MFDVFNERTGDVIRRCRDVLQANRIAISYEETYAWINGDKFSYRPVTDENSNNDKPGRETARICSPAKRAANG